MNSYDNRSVLKIAGLKNSVVCLATYGAPASESFQNSDGWTVTLKYQGRQMTTYFYMGYGHKGEAPTASDVLDCLISDTSGFDSTVDFEDWADTYGYDSDSCRVERVYRTIKKQAAKVHRLLGADFEAIGAAVA